MKSKNKNKTLKLIILSGLLACLVLLPLKPSLALTNIKYPASIYIFTDKAEIGSDGHDLALLTVVATDKDGKGLKNVLIKFGNNGGKDTISPTEGLTDSEGRVAFKITSLEEHISEYSLTLKDPNTGADYLKSNTVKVRFLSTGPVSNVLNTISDFRNDPATQKAVIYVATPAITAVAVVGLYSSIANLVNSFLPFLNYLLNLLFQLLGIRRRQKPWGVVYDSMTKEPVDLAFVRLFDAKTKSIVQTVVTDKMGRFGFSSLEGKYYIVISKYAHIFPSKLLKGNGVDGAYHELYFGESFSLKRGQRLTISVPIDLETAIEARVGALDRLKSLSVKISLPFFIISLILTIIVLWINPTIYNEVLVVLYIITIVFRKGFRKSQVLPWGIVFNSKTKEPLSGVPIKIFESKYGRLLETRISDEGGRFNFILPKGEYYIKIASFVYKISKDSKEIGDSVNYKGEPFKVEQNEVLRFNIPLEIVK